MLARSVTAFVLVALATLALAQEQATLGKDGRASIKAPFGGSEIEIGISARMAGAIDSLKWKGVQFVDDYDHGRELQSAASFDGHGECFNPTEAGSYRDDKGATSSSKLLFAEVGGTTIKTRTRMAFWLAPGETSPACKGKNAVNTAVLSDFELSKTVTLGAFGIPNVIEHDITYHVPTPHRRAVFAAVSAWLPGRFQKFYAFDAQKNELKPMEAKRGNQGVPLIIATKDDSYAMGFYSPDLPQNPRRPIGYGRNIYRGLFDFHPTTRGGCSFRFPDVKPGDYRFICYSVVGSLEDVKSSIARLTSVAKPTR